MIFLFLSSGLFLGWSLGANDAANVFGTAVGTKMIKFKTAVLIASIFVILGAVIDGAGASHTLGKLGSINALAGSFTVALASAITVAVMTKFRLPVSTSQAIVGAIIGWNFFSGSLTDINSLTKIVLTWMVCPILAGSFSFVLFNIFKHILDRSKIHLLVMDAYTRIALIVVGAFGAYSLGANNIANVMGVFTNSSPFHNINVYGLFTFSGTQQLFLLGSIAIGIGILTYSHKVIRTVGGSLFKLSPITAFIVVLSHSLVLYIFASQELRNLLVSYGLPPIPLVPVSSSQAVIGAILGIAIAKGGRNIKFNVLGKISTSWVTTPIIASIISFIALFFVQNVFDLKVYNKITYNFSDKVINQLEENGVDSNKLKDMKGKNFSNALRLQSELKHFHHFNNEEIKKIFKYSAVDTILINEKIIRKIVDRDYLTKAQLDALIKIQNKSFSHIWEFQYALMKLSDDWRFKEKSQLNKRYNESLNSKYEYLISLFRISKE
ncbi:MAG: inorganic phosphate transporter [Candidatus Cloacimonetes bacterium]|nr:inorganic phosphate transporter [Candidatus Cloacimonadota bacterium]